MLKGWKQEDNSRRISGYGEENCRQKGEIEELYKVKARKKIKHQNKVERKIIYKYVCMYVTEKKMKWIFATYVCMYVCITIK